ncbi:hypothetical protein [Kitasatospora terrestris]|uniref:PLL-like beta propeller domain-containing protein n=1 Tax=Kitasatospora terrestris TaxID=258051 RepID=A0ABP9DFG6_9ACTN
MTTLDKEWVERLAAANDRYFNDQSGGRDGLEITVYDWFELPFTLQQWLDFGTNAGPNVRPVVAQGLGVDLSGYQNFVLVIDVPGAALGATFTGSDGSLYSHMAASDLNQAIVGHELGHHYGARHANLSGPSGPIEYGNRFCIMGLEGSKFSFLDPGLNITNADGTVDESHSASGPGMVCPSLRACGWLDLSRWGENLTTALHDAQQGRAVLQPLRGAPPASSPARKVVAYADGVIGGKRIVVEYRVPEGWDRSLPAEAPGWVVVHQTGPEDGSTESLQIGAMAATPGAGMMVPGQLNISVGSATADQVDLAFSMQVSAGITRKVPAVASWAPERLDVLAVGLDAAMWHKAWAQQWQPGQSEWEPLGGGFSQPPAVASWGPQRLDIFGVGLHGAMYHKAFANGGWHPTPGWEPLGGGFTSAPAVASWGPDRLDVFALGLDAAMWHKAWAQQWQPGQSGWEPLGGGFSQPPAVASWGPQRLDIFGVGLHGAMYHKAFANGGWHPTPGWEPLGGGFTSAPAVASWGPDRLDVFAVGLDSGMWHKAWAKEWQPGQSEWEPLGGTFESPPTVASWGPNRLDVFAVGLDGGMYHRALVGGSWQPETSWEFLGGVFTSPPKVVAWAPNRLDVFAVGRDRGMWHKAWAQEWKPSPTGWEALGGGFT